MIIGVTIQTKFTKKIGNIVKLLLSRGADPNLCHMEYRGEYSNRIPYWEEEDVKEVDHIVESPLEIAVDNFDKNVVKLLIEHGANPNYGNVFDVIAGKEDMEIFKMVVEAGLNFNEIYYHNQSIAITAIFRI